MAQQKPDRSTTRDKSTATYKVTLKPEEAARVTAAASSEGLSVSSYLRRLAVINSRQAQ